MAEALEDVAVGERSGLRVVLKRCSELSSSGCLCKAVGYFVEEDAGVCFDFGKRDLKFPVRLNGANLFDVGLGGAVFCGFPRAVDPRGDSYVVV